MAYFKCVSYHDKIFGDGRDDDGTGTVTLTTTSWNADTEDSGVIEKCYEHLIIPNGVSITAGNRNAGMIIRCRGNCTIEGSISNLFSPKTLTNAQADALSEYYPLYLIENGSAGNGGAGGNGVNGSASGGAGGSGMNGRFYGGGHSGGGGGGCGYTEVGGFSGHYGRSGGSSQNNTIDIPTIFIGGGVEQNGSYGGGGGQGSGYGGGGGGNGAGANGPNGGDHRVKYNDSWYYGYSGGGGGAGNYGGGVIIIYCKGILTINGTINCAGSNGGIGGSRPTRHGTAGGTAGGGGGGRVYLLANTNNISSATINVSGGTGANNGGSGDKYCITYGEYRKGSAPIPIVA